MKKLSLLCIFILILSLMVSCNNGGADNAVSNPSKTVKVSLNMFSADSSAQKTLAIDFSNIDHYTYTATPQWTSQDWENIQGTQTTETTVSQGASVWFAQGLWLIKVKAYATGVTNPIATGELTCYISSQTSSLEIPITRVAGDGKIAITITVPELSEGGGALTLDYYAYGGEPQVFSGGFTKTISNHIITYTGTITDVPAGSYILNFMFGDSNVDFRYGESYAAEVFADMTTSVTGDLAVGTLVQAGKTKVLYGAPNKAITFVCLDDAEKFAWYVNGVQQQYTERRFFIFTPTEYTTDEAPYIIECKLNDGTSVGTAKLIVRDPITIYLHFANDSLDEQHHHIYLDDTVVQYHTYTNLINKDAEELTQYRTSMYVQNWYTAEENGTGGGGSIYNSTANFTADTHLYAHRNYYTVKFNQNYTGSGSNRIHFSPTEISGYQGTELGMWTEEGELPIPTISGNNAPSIIFLGWYTQSNGGSRIDESTLIPASTTTQINYYAHWDQLDITYNPSDNNHFAVVLGTVFYNTRDNAWMFKYQSRPLSVEKNHAISYYDGSGPWYNPRADYEDYITYPQTGNPDYAQYNYSTVDGWYKQYKWKNGEVVLFDKWDLDTVVTSNMIIYANAVRDADKCTINFNTYSSESTISPMTVYRRVVVDNPPAPPTRGNDFFAGWFEDEAYTKPFNFDIDPVMGDSTHPMTLHALWLDPNARTYLKNASETSGACIDIDYVPDDNTRLVIEFAFDGDREVTLAGIPTWGIQTEHVRKTFAGVFGSDVIRATEVNYTDREKHTIEFSVAHGFQVDGRVYGTPSSSGLSTDKSICIFKASSDDTYSAVGKCYNVKVYSGDTLERNLYPYYDPDHRVLGLYDTVGHGFYRSSVVDAITDN